jgi:predicted enzyme related to lactoylglutathione lyase
MKGLLGAVWLYSSDVAGATAFYRDVLELPLVEEESDGVAHFDAGNVRLSIHPWERDGSPGVGGFYVFVVEDVEAETERLRSSGVEIHGGIRSEPFGRIAEFRDPDGHELYLWQLPSEGEPEFAHVEPLVRHYRRLARQLNLA